MNAKWRLAIVAVWVTVVAASTRVTNGGPPAVYVKGTGSEGYTGQMYLQGTNRLFCLNTASLYEVVQSGGRIVEAVRIVDPKTGQTDPRHRIEFGVWKSPGWGRDVAVSTYRDGAAVVGVMFSTVPPPGEDSRSMGQTTGCFSNQHPHPVPDATVKGRAGGSSHPSTIEILGQRLTGQLFIAPLKGRSGAWVAPAEMIGEYFVVNEAPQGFVFGGEGGSSEAADGVVLFGGERLLTNASLEEEADGNFRLSLQTAGAENPRAADFRANDKSPPLVPTALVGNSAPVPRFQRPPAPGQLVFGRVVRPRSPHAEWRLNTDGVFDRFLAAQAETLARNPGDRAAALKRGRLQRQLGRFAEAIEDYRRAGETIVVEITHDGTELRVETELRAKLSKGEKVKVSQCQGDWLWATTDSASGWVDQQHVQ